jgi:hypothetical protein
VARASLQATISEIVKAAIANPASKASRVRKLILLIAVIILVDYYFPAKVIV